MKFKIKALRGPSNGKLFEREMELELCETLGPLGQRIELHGGSTGFESFYLEDYMLGVKHRLANRAYEKGNLLTWVACMGTPGKYDRVIVPDDQMRAAFTAFGIEVPT